MSNDATSPDHGFVVPSMKEEMPRSPLPALSRVTPWVFDWHVNLVMDWVHAGLGGEETVRLLGPRGEVAHGEMYVAGGLVLFAEADGSWSRVPSLIRLYVDDAREQMERAVAAGGRMVSPVSYLPFGDLLGRVADPAGNLWWLNEHVEDVPPEELERRLADPHWQHRMDASWSTLNAFMQEVGT